MDDERSTDEEPDTAEREKFEALAARLLAVSKDELDDERKKDEARKSGKPAPA